MGFFKFLKREKKKEASDLDVPPAPPPLEGFESQIPEPPKFDSGMTLDQPPLPQFDSIDIPKVEFPSMDSIPDMNAQDKNIPEFPDFPDMPQDTGMQEEPIEPPVASDFAPVNNYDAQSDDFAPESVHSVAPPDKIAKDIKSDFIAQTQKKPVVHQRHVVGTTAFIKVEDFRKILGHVSVIRGDLRKSEESLVKLEQLKHSKDKTMDSLRVSLIELEKRLIFVDKNLFKGE